MKANLSSTSHFTNDPFDKDYKILEELFSSALDKVAGQQLYKTNAAGLWLLYLETIPEESRKYYNCQTCKKFFDDYVNLVTITDAGLLFPVFTFDSVKSDRINNLLQKIHIQVFRSQITLPFYPEGPVLGHSTTGVWNHFHTKVPVSSRKEVDASKQLHNNILLKSAIECVSVWELKQAIRVLEHEPLPNSQNAIDQAKFLLALKQQLHQFRQSPHRVSNLLWKASTSAPEGWCHVSSSLIGSVLKDISDKLPYQTIVQRWKAKVNPLTYQRPTTVKEGTVNQAEDLFAKLGTKEALRRRFARLDDLTTCWREEQPKPLQGLFSSVRKLASKPRTVHSVKLPTLKISWADFKLKVLPKAINIRASVPTHGNYFSFVTAAVEESPVFLRWDNQFQRNPVSWYVYYGGSKVDNWFHSLAYVQEFREGLTNVTAICENPATWDGMNSNREPKLFLCLEGCRDKGYKSGGLFFPDMLRSEYHGVRSVLEAFSNESVIEGIEQGDANGIALNNESIKLRVIDESGNTTEYVLEA